MALQTQIHDCNYYCQGETHCAVVACYGALQTAADVLGAYQRQETQTGMHVFSVQPATEPPAVPQITTLLDAMGRRSQHPWLPLAGWWRLHFTWVEEEG